MLRLALRVPAEDADVVLAELIAIAPSGVEQVDGDGWVEYAIYGAPGELPSLPDLEATVGDVLVEVTTSEVADDWAHRWREFHKPLVVGDRLRVRPPWEAQGTEAFDVVIDPALAFGTGAHATTRLCLELLLDIEPRGSLFDLGCGSGVIAVLAAKLGFAPVAAADYDQLGVDATIDNAAVNGVEIEVSKLDLRTDPIPHSDILVANILASVLVVLASKLGSQRPVKVVLSGILDEQADSVLEVWQHLGYSQADRRSREGWTALLLATNSG